MKDLSVGIIYDVEVEINSYGRRSERKFVSFKASESIMVCSGEGVKLKLFLTAEKEQNSFAYAATETTAEVTRDMFKEGE